MGIDTEDFLKNVAETQDLIVTGYAINRVIELRESRRELAGVRHLTLVPDEVADDIRALHRGNAQVFSNHNAKMGVPTSWDTILLAHAFGAVSATDHETLEFLLLNVAATAIEMYEQSRRDSGGATDDIAEYFRALGAQANDER